MVISELNPDAPLHLQQIKNVMRRVAIPISQNELSEFFGECNHYEIFEIDKKIVNRKLVEIPFNMTILKLPEWLKNQGVTDVIAYKVNKQIISLFASNKVNVFVGVHKKSPQNLIDDYLQGTLESDKNIIEEITNN
ncbi:MAG: hypothetical protein L3J56_14665 [Bacteroidales bacterium]|nr:hypothetical protein [Bacteroidales bacterium]